MKIKFPFNNVMCCIRLIDRIPFLEVDYPHALWKAESAFLLSAGVGRAGGRAEKHDLDPEPENHRDRPKVIPWPDPVRHSPGRAAPTPDSTAAAVDSRPPPPPPGPPGGTAGRRSGLAVTGAHRVSTIRAALTESGSLAGLRPSG